MGFLSPLLSSPLHRPPPLIPRLVVMNFWFGSVRFVLFGCAGFGLDKSGFDWVGSDCTGVHCHLRTVSFMFNVLIQV